jgi:uncharacterized lipoprotein YehR (DUF1307 family)
MAPNFQLSTTIFYFSTSVSLSGVEDKEKQKYFRCNLGRNFVAISPFFQNLKFEYLNHEKLIK